MATLCDSQHKHEAGPDGGGQSLRVSHHFTGWAERVRDERIATVIGCQTAPKHHSAVLSRRCSGASIASQLLYKERLCVGQRRQVCGSGLALFIDGLTPIAGGVPMGDACRRTAEDDRGI